MLSYEAIQSFVFQEARALDERRWADWLEFYAEDVEFWMPAWDEDDTLTNDPQREVSLIYYANRSGLEDRIFRIETERSSATIPDTRTTHMISNVLVLEQDDKQIKLRFNWHTTSVRYNHTDHFSGTSFYTLDVTGASPLIKEKKVVLKTDYIRHVIDVYHI